MRVCILLVLATSLASCSASECGTTALCGTRSAAEAVAGSWTEVETWQGISMRMSVAAMDTVLSGTATYGMTNGGIGTASITGYVFWQDSAFVPSGNVMAAHPVVVLNLAFSNGMAARFDQAVLREQDTLRGALTFAGEPFKTYGTTFVRAVP